jgi:hypothetical protein
MMQALLSRMSLCRQRASALLHRPDQLAADAADRRERWKQVIAEHQKPLGQKQGTPTSPTGNA